MPITRIEVNEYNCMQCGYKWINRVNGKDGPVPKYCASCKRSTWNGKKASSEEKGLMARITNMGKFYEKVSIENLKYRDGNRQQYELVRNVWDEKLVDQFLNLNNPRPTLKELEAVCGSKQDIQFSDFELSVIGGNRGVSRRWGFIHDPDRPGWGKLDITAYQALLISEAEKRKEFMRVAIRERGLEPVDSSPDHVPIYNRHNRFDANLGKQLLDLGRTLEEAGTTPRHEICARLVKELSSHGLHREDIERLCPPEWKPIKNK